RRTDAVRASTGDVSATGRVPAANSLDRIGHSNAMTAVVVASAVGFLISSAVPAIAQTQATSIAKILPIANASAEAPAAVAAEPALVLTTRLQPLVDDVRERLAIPQQVAVSIVAQDKLLVSVQRMPSRDG